MNNNVAVNTDYRYVEICELPEGDLAGRTKIKMSALKIHPDNAEWNSNGITWTEEYVDNNIASLIGSPYVVSWMDEESQIPSDHGEMSYDGEGNVIFKGVAVGAIQDAYITTVEVNGVDTKVLMTEGYLFHQRYYQFVEWLRHEIKSNTIYGSIEINGKGKSKSIEYLDGHQNEDGTPKMGRVPTIFDFTALAILYISDPADTNSIVFEVNTKVGDSSKMELVSKAKSIELNKLSYDDIAALITKAFNLGLGVKDYYSDYYIYRFYPVSSEVIFRKWDVPAEYYMTTYKIENASVSIGDIVKVEEDWKPVNDSQPVEINASKIRDTIINQKGGTNLMGVEELNTKIAELSTQLTELSTKVTELNSTNVEKDSKIAELSEALTVANKTLGEVNTKCSTLEVECNGYKEEKAAQEAEKVKAEVNAYFETEIPKGGFEDADVEALKQYVEKCDLTGLKAAETELIVKKFKAATSAANVETNAKTNDLFFTTKVEKIDDVEAGKSLFTK